MPKRVKNVKPKDANELAHRLTRTIIERTEATAEPSPPVSAELREYLSEIGTRGGRVSGARRMTNLTPEQRREIAAKAARARWMRANKRRKPARRVSHG